MFEVGARASCRAGVGDRAEIPQAPAKDNLVKRKNRTRPVERENYRRFWSRWRSLGELNPRGALREQIASSRNVGVSVGMSAINI